MTARKSYIDTQMGIANKLGIGVDVNEVFKLCQEGYSEKKIYEIFLEKKTMKKEKDEHWQKETTCPNCGGPVTRVKALSGPPGYFRKSKTLSEIQKEIKVWANKNFGKRLGLKKRPSWHPLLGIGEELGELNHAYLKKEQKIRNGVEKYQKGAQDAIGDLVIYVIDFCNQEDFDIEEILTATWDKVKQRNWEENAEHGNDVDRKV